MPPKSPSPWVPYFSPISSWWGPRRHRLLPLAQKTYEETIKESFPKAHLEVNLKAFGQGMGLVQ